MFVKKLERPLERVGRMASEKWGVTVVYQGSIPCTDGKRIILPAKLPRNYDARLERMLLGFIDHECAHIKATNFKYVEQANRDGGTVFDLFNHIEDVRVERHFAKEFPGADYIFMENNKEFLDATDANWLSLPLKNRAVRAARYIMMGRPIPEDPTLDAIREKISAKALALNKCKDTKDVYNASKAIAELIDGEVSKLEEERNKAKEPANDEVSDSHDNAGSDRDDSHVADGDREPGSEPDTDKDHEEHSPDTDDAPDATPDEDCADPIDSEGDSDDETDSEVDDHDNAESSDSEDKSGETDDDAGDMDTDEHVNSEDAAEDDADAESEPGQYDPEDNAEHGGDETGDNAEEMNTDGDGSEAPALTMEEFIADEFKDADKKKKGKVIPGDDGSWEYKEPDGIAGYKVLTTAFDKVIDVSGKSRHSDTYQFDQIINDVNKILSPLRNELERALKVVQNARMVGERERGRWLDARQLTQVAINPNHKRAFQEFRKTETNDVAVEILADCSGSMGGCRQETAQRTAVALSKTLTYLDIVHEITGFTSDRYRLPQSVLDLAYGERYNRHGEILQHVIAKSWECNRLEGVTQLFARAQNTDGESVWWAAKRLAERKEKRKILIVLSDGKPANYSHDPSGLHAHLKAVVGQVEDFGIECIGIGIQSDAVSYFYPKHVVVNDLTHLADTAIRTLGKILVDGFKKMR